MALPIKDNVSWVGKADWELRRFHGDEYSTHRGSTYNSYLIKEEKTAIIDTVWAPFGEEYVDSLAKEVDLKKIDFVIANHAEIDHSGGLPALMARIPDVPIYCTANGVKSLRGHYHMDWNFHPVKTGDRLSLGRKDLVFIEAPMLHWPDSMFCYLTGDNILFSNDAFGQHLATEALFNDLVDEAELLAECVKYYANILTPFSELVKKKIAEVLALNLPVDVICPSHGVVWRKDPLKIVRLYQRWADAYQEDQITIVYDTMWNGTRRLAEAIAQGLRDAAPQTTLKLYNLAKSDKNDVITEVFRSRAIVVGSPTINKGILTSVAALLDQLKGLGFRKKRAAAFGCYGWSGEAVKTMRERLTEAGFAVVDEGRRCLWNPTDEDLAGCVEYGRRLAGLLA